jgi:Domain of unknown function (DUF4351)
MIHGPDNFAVCDLARSFTFACLTQDVARNQPYTLYHFLEPAGYMMIDSLHLSPVHASCIALNGRAVLLCGDAGAGKTSLAYACARKGWTYLSDDATHIVRGRADRAVVGRPFRIRFRESASRLFPELKQFTPERRPNGKLDIEVETEALGISVALESNASHVVFLNRQDEFARAKVEPFAPTEAARRLRNLTCYGDEKTRSEQSHALTEFLQLPTLELTYGDLDGAENALRALAECKDWQLIMYLQFWLDWGERPRAFRRILERIAAESPGARDQALAELLILARLRRLSGGEVMRETEKMPILEDIMEHDVIGPLLWKGRAEGRVEGQVEILLSQIHKRFGRMPPAVAQRIAALKPAQLKRVGLRLLDAQAPFRGAGAEGVVCGLRANISGVVFGTAGRIFTRLLQLPCDTRVHVDLEWHWRIEILQTRELGMSQGSSRVPVAFSERGILVTAHIRYPRDGN